MYLCTYVLKTFDNKVLTVKEHLQHIMVTDWAEQSRHVLKSLKCSLTWLLYTMAKHIYVADFNILVLVVNYRYCSAQ